MQKPIKKDSIIISMKDYSTFIFDRYSFSSATGIIELFYSLDDEIEFKETVIIPMPKEAHSPSDAALQALHLAGGTSYYKTCCPKNIEVRSTELNKKQAHFWNTVYEKGLGEFFYHNQIDFRGLINFPVSDDSVNIIKSDSKKEGVLIPIGGGKDSIVTIEKLRAEGKDITIMRMGSHPLIDALAKEMNLPCMNITRKLSGTLFDLNADGALNGHIPITAYLSALCVVIAEIYGFEAIALSNEKSANIGNVEYLGTEVNHQWSKSEEFENMFQDYVQQYIDPDLKYESILRKMTELEIVGEMCNYPQYFELFTSCNKNWKISGEHYKSDGSAMKSQCEARRTAWCGTCPKCAFAFCLFAAYLPEEVLQTIFGKNLFEDEALLPLYKELLGLEGFKPFECVGTPEETTEAFSMIKERGELNSTPIFKALS